MATSTTATDGNNKKFICWPIFLIPAAVLAVAPQMPSWMFMWLLCSAIFFALKWATFTRYLNREIPARGWGIATLESTAPVETDWQLALGYIFAWPGMNPDQFFALPSQLQKPVFGKWLTALGNTVLGALLVWGVARFIPPQYDLAVGWIGMIGLIFLLHFGSFHLLALIWQSRGIDAKTLMHFPAASSSLADFWGRRWNRAFRDLSYLLVFRPLALRYGTFIAMLGTYFLSGVIHDLVISLPAGGGYGLPTLYFLLQGIGQLVERSKVGRRFGLGKGIGGRIFTLALVAGGAPLLFHPLFVRQVVLPMMIATGAI